MKGKALKILSVFLFLQIVMCVYCESVDLVSIKGGKFKRGEKNGKDNPLQTIFVDDFKISKHQITVGLYREFLKEANPKSILFDDNRLLYLLNLPRNFKIPNDWPIFQVNFYEALEFCNWLSIRDGFDPVYTIEYLSEKEVNVEWDVNKNGYRLPTEAEWEYAASGGGRDKNILSEDEKILDEYAWLSFNYGNRVHSVGLKKPNVFGLYDVLGNVSEWCWDLYDVDYYRSGITNNPRGPEIGNNPDPYYTEYKLHRVTDRVIRGSSVISPMADTYFRAGMQPYPTVLFIVGFRVARN